MKDLTVAIASVLRPGRWSLSSSSVSRGFLRRVSNSFSLQFDARAIVFTTPFGISMFQGPQEVRPDKCSVIDCLHASQECPLGVVGRGYLTGILTK